MARRRTRTNRHGSRWTQSDEDRLLRQVRAFPQNLRRCFMIVAEETGRTPGAVANHWYSVTSKGDAWCFFTASEKHVSKNRKNGKGQESTTSIWRRLMNILRNFC